MIKRFHILLLTAVLLASCTQEEVQEGSCVMTFRLVTDTTRVVRTDSLGTTRAPDRLNDNDSFIFPADFTVAVDGTYYMYTANSAGTDMVGWAKVAFPVSGASVRVQAFYPSLWTTNTTQSFTVRYNQNQTSIGIANYRACDLMYGLPKSDFQHLDDNGKVKPTDDPIPLVFEHKMVKVCINVTTNGATVKQITMKNVKRSIDFNTTDASFSNLNTADDDFGDNVSMYNDVIGTSSNFVCTALIPQQNLAAGTQFIEVVLRSSPSDMTFTYTLNDAANFESGKQYIFNLAVVMDKLDVSCSIANWNTSPEGWTNISEILRL